MNPIKREYYEQEGIYEICERCSKHVFPTDESYEDNLCSEYWDKRSEEDKA